MASILGANIYSDIFFVAFKLPNLFRRIFAEGAFTQCFIPSYATTKHKIQFSTIIFIKFLSFILLLSLTVTLFSEFITYIIALGFDKKTIKLASPLVAICFYYLPLIFIVTFLSALLQYKNHFTTTAYGTSFLNLSLIGSLLIFSNLEHYEIAYNLSIAVIVGGLLQVLVHMYTIKKLKIKFLTTQIKKSKATFKESKFYNQFYPAVFGNSSAHIASFLDTWLASFLTSGTISYLYYANRVFQLPLALFAIAVSVAIFPTIAKLLKSSKEKEAMLILKKSFFILFSLLFCATTIGIILDDFIIKLLFQRGSFDQIDTQNTSLILTMYLIGLTPFGMSKILSLWLYSMQKQLVAAKITAISLGWNIVFSLILIIPFGATGLAFASTLSGFILFWLTLKEFGYKKFWSFFV